MTSFRAGAATNTGRVREGNEDFLLADKAAGIFVVADGMGGHRGGEIASHLSVETLERRLKKRARGERLNTDLVVTAVQEANDALVARAHDDPELRGMGTTLCALVLVEPSNPDDGDDDELLGLVNVGDSRVYLLKDGELEQITEDHSLVATLERQGRLSKAEAAVHPQRNILTRALGIDSKVMVDSWEIRPVVGDRYLLCSDGLFNELDDARIEATLRRLADPEEAAQELVRLANESGGRDNITVVVVDVVEGEADGDTSADRIVSSKHAGDRVLEIDDAGDATRQLPAMPTDSPGSSRSPDSDDPDASKAVAAAPRKRRLITWRVVFFLIVVGLVFVVAAGFVWYYATQPYFVAFSPGATDDPADDQVAVYQGQPGGLLGFEPELRDADYGITRADVEQFAPDEVDKIDAGVSKDSHSDAERYIDNLSDTIRRVRNQQKINRGENPGTGTTTTTPSPVTPGG